MVKRKVNANVGSQAAPLVISESPKGPTITPQGAEREGGKQEINGGTGEGVRRDGGNVWRYRSGGETGWGECLGLCGDS